MRARAAILMLSVLAATVAGAPAEARTTAVVDPGVVAPANGTVLRFGGDVSTLRAPARLGPTRVVGGSWRTFNATAPAGVPDDGVAAVVLDGRVSRARGAGSILARPLGSTSGGSPLLKYRPSGGRGLSVVKVGWDGGIQLRSSGGSPTAAVRVVAWLPETTSFRVGEGPARTSTRVGTTPRSVALPGVPDQAGSVLLKLTITARRSGTLHSWATGQTRPVQGLSFRKGTSSVVDVAAVGEDGSIRLRSSRGNVDVVARVLAWTPTDSSLTALPDRLLASVRAGRTRAVRVAGAAGVPGDAEHVWASLTAPAGARVRIWDDATDNGSPIHDWRADGSTTSVLVPVPPGAKIAVRVTGTTANTRLVAHGFNFDRANQQVVLEPRVGTHLLGWGDVESFQGTTLVLAKTADPVAAGDHLQVRGSDGLPYTLKAMTTESTRSGRQAVEVTPATLSDAFADVRLSYGTDPGPSATKGRLAGRAGRAAVSRSVGTSLGTSLGLGNWSCSINGSAPAFDLDFSGDPHLDVNLSAGTFDFSLKGQLTSTTEWSGSQTVSCSYEGQFAQIPLGTTPVAIKLGPTATFTVNPHGEEATVTATSTQRLYASIYYDGGEPIVGKALDADASSDAALGPGTAQLDIGLKVALGPASLGEFELGPEVSATLGASYVLAPPDPNTDPYGRYLAGPRCTDVTNTLFLGFGAALLVPFLPDVSLDIARFDTDPVTLYRGPCVGYEGTITYRYQGSNHFQGSLSCTGVPESCNDWNHTVVKTLTPGPASFTPWGEVMQPYSWTWTGRDRSFVKNWNGSNWNSLCNAVHDGSGAGIVGWETEAAYPSPEGWTVPKIFQGGTARQLEAEMGVGHGRGTRVTTVTDYDFDDGMTCGDSGASEAQIPSIFTATDGVGGAEIWRSQITVVADNNVYLPAIGIATFNLTRREYTRN